MGCSVSIFIFWKPQFVGKQTANDLYLFPFFLSLSRFHFLVVVIIDPVSEIYISPSAAAPVSSTHTHPPSFVSENNTFSSDWRAFTIHIYWVLSWHRVDCLSVCVWLTSGDRRVVYGVSVYAYLCGCVASSQRKYLYDLITINNGPGFNMAFTAAQSVRFRFQQ